MDGKWGLDDTKGAISSAHDSRAWCPKVGAQAAGAAGGRKQLVVANAQRPGLYLQ